MLMIVVTRPAARSRSSCRRSLGSRPPRYGLTLLAQFGVPVGDRAAEPFDLLPRAAEADGAHALPGCFANQRHADRAGALAVERVSVALRPRAD